MGGGGDGSEQAPMRVNPHVTSDDRAHGATAKSSVGTRAQPIPAHARLLMSLQQSAGNRAVAGLAQRAREETERSNDTDLPDELKDGIESLSGVSLDGVQVHYNSSAPARLGAAAYAQGSDIHVGPGAEEHLPHEAWHAVQQAHGRVQPTTQLQGGVPLNDDEALEREADAMGSKAAAGPSVQRSPEVVQRVREHFVPDVREPHVHVHDGGVTFTDIGHAHKYLVRGDERLENNIREVRADLAQRGDARSRKIKRWIARRI